MRKAVSRLATAVVVLSAFGVAHAAPSALKPYIVLILDTSGSMKDPTGSGPPSCGGTDSKLNHARCAINKIVNTYGDIVFAFGKFRETPTGTFATDCATDCDTNALAGDCSNCDTGTGAGCTSSDAADHILQMVTSLQDGNNQQTATYTDFSCNTCAEPFGPDLTAGQDPEILFANSWTPLNGSFRGAKRYWTGQQATDGTIIWPNTEPGFNPIVSDPTNGSFLPTGCDPSPSCSSNCCATQCRPYITIMLTDGDETCSVINDSWPAVGNVAATATIAASPNGAKENAFTISNSPNGATDASLTIQSTGNNGATEAGTTATFRTTTNHNLAIGNVVVVSGVGNASYNGTWTVTGITSGTRFTVTLPTSGLTTSGGGTVAQPNATITTTTNHGLAIGDTVLISGVGVAGYNGTYTVVTVPSNTTFTIVLATSGLAASGGGTVGTKIATFTTTAAHGFALGDIVTVSGVGVVAYNGTWTITSVPSTTTFTVLMSSTGIAASGGGTVGYASGLLATDLVTNGTLKRYRIETHPIGFGTPVPYGQIENIAHAGGLADGPGNEGYYAADEAGLELAISQIVEGSLRTELCNGQDDDCDGSVDEDFKPPLGNGCDNGLKGVCKGTGTYVCSADGTGVVCNITSPGGTAQTTCPGAPSTCSPDGTETCNDGLDNDCDGFVDEGCTVCNPVAELCNGHDDNCNGTIDEGIPTKACGVFPGAACSPNAACCGTQVCTGPCVGQPASCVGTDGYGFGGVIGACSASWTVVPEICNGIDDDCDGVVDEDLTKTCSSITGNGCATAPCPGSNNPGDPGAYHCTGLKQACAGPSDTSCPGMVACIPPIPQNVCHAGTTQCTGGTQGSCMGEVTPGVEICDGLDNDCDNIIDEDTGGGACNATCGVGTILCAGSPADPTCCQPGSCAPGQHQCGTLYCSAVSVTSDDTCNNMDDNCNGQVDEGWTCGAFRCQGAIQTECQGTTDTTTCGANGPCIANPSTPLVACACSGTGICNGKVKCVQGVANPATTCQGTPQDPSSCCDCGGTPNNGLCSGGASCASNCQCAYPCSGGEFPCPSGKKCDTSGGQPGLCVPDPCFGVSCTTDPNTGNAQACADQNGAGVCVDACTLNANCPAPGSVPQCPAGGGVVCDAKTGACVPNDCRSFPSCCAANQNCVVDTNTGIGACVTNLCAGVTCPSDQYCEQGNCVKSCSGVTCPGGQRCHLGACETDPCGHACPSGKVCNDASGACVDDVCQTRNCPQGQWCNPNDGMCEPDPCVGTMCPADPPGQVCKGGTCYDPSQLGGGNDAGSHVTVAGGGCAAGGGGVGVVFALLLLRRRRAKGARQ